MKQQDFVYVRSYFEVEPQKRKRNCVCMACCISGVSTLAEMEMLQKELPLGAAGGKSLPDAIRDKYFSSEPLSWMVLGPVKILSNMPVCKDSSSGSISLPPYLSLNYCCVVCAGEAGEIETMCQQVKELDLAENSLSDWNEILAITNQIPRLQFLNLSSNPLATSISPELNSALSLSRITCLVLNNTCVPWDTVYVLLDSTPVLEQLHLSLNNYGTVVPADKTYSTLTLLQFNRNDISDWTDVEKLGQMFPNLESLFVAENYLTGLTGSVGPNFPKLGNLCVSETRLSSWEEIDALNSFPSLTSVRLKRVPLEDAHKEKERLQLMVARLMRQVTRINGSRITESEREDAERAFIRYYMDRDDKPDRYHKLVAVYGNLKPLVDVDLRPKKDALCLVSFEGKSKQFQVPIRWTLSQLKQFLQDFVGLPPSKFQVYHLEPDLQCGANAMRFPAKVLYSYNVKDGDELLVHRKM